MLYDTFVAATAHREQSHAHPNLCSSYVTDLVNAFKDKKDKKDKDKKEKKTGKLSKAEKQKQKAIEEEEKKKEAEAAVPTEPKQHIQRE